MIEILKKIALFSGLNDADLVKISAISSRLFFKKDEIQSIKSLFVTNFKLFSDLLDEVLNKERRLLELDDELIQQLIKKCIIDNDSAPYLCNSLRKLIDDVKDYYKSKSMEPPGRNFYLKFFWKKSNGKPYSPSSFNNYTLY